MYLDVKKSGERAGFCWALSDVCEAKRQLTVDKGYGTPTECFTQTAAFCVRIDDTHEMLRQYMCAPTANECADTRQNVLDHPVKDTDEVSECHVLLNTDPYRPIRADDRLDSLP